ALVAEADAREQAHALFGGLLLRVAEHVDGRLGDVLERRLVREEVEALEDHADLRPLAGDALLRVLDELPLLLPVADEVAVHRDPAAVDLLQVVDAADERRLAGPGRPDDADRLPLLDVERDALQHLEPTEALVHVLRAHDDVGHRVLQAVTGFQAACRRSKNGISSPRSLAARFRSIAAWMNVQTVVSTRYQNATPRKYSAGRNEFE